MLCLMCRFWKPSAHWWIGLDVKSDEAGAERDALASLIQSAQSRLQNSHHAIPPPPALVADPEQTPPRSGVKRAPHGVVRNMVKEDG